MTTQQVADRFNELSREGKWTDIQQELYADDAVSIEPAHAQELPSVEGKAAIKQKGKLFNQMIEEVHGGYSGEPIVAGNHFAVAMGMDVTMKERGRLQLDEIAVYEVKDGQIISEKFFF